MAYTEKQHQHKVNTFEDVTIEMRNLYEAKNKDYNDSFGRSYEEWGLPMVCIRLDDKLNRLKSFAKNKEMFVKDEKVEDTLMDLANYCVMALVEMKLKQKEDKEEVRYVK